MNWPLIIVLGIAVIAFIIFVLRRNLKDEKDFEDAIKNDYHHTARSEKADIESERRVK
jgi:low affinity Fe/Cu permease